MMRPYTDLDVWQWASELTLEIYGTSAGFPKEHLAGITLRLRRLSSKVAACIAEACCREDEAEFPSFLLIALSFVRDLEETLGTTREMGLLRPTDYERHTGQVQRIRDRLDEMIHALRS